jgi:NAD(P)H-hydrate repair Nnr-like enzyme with NAD(P)H-hydrate epimerase domain
MRVPVVDPPPVADIVVDALIGYSLRGDPRGRVAERAR